MDKYSREEREILARNIESGAYKTKDGIATIGQCWFLFFMLLAFPILGIIDVVHGDSGLNIGGLAATAILPLIMLFLACYRTKEAKNEKIDQERIRRLVLEGEIIEATIDSIDKVYGGHCIVCRSDYNGQEQFFKSETFDVAPSPSENRSISVFIEHDNPNNYFVNYCERIPGNASNFLRDTSELRQDKNVPLSKKMKVVGDYLAETIGTLIIMALPLILGIFAAINGKLFLSYLCSIFVVVFSFSILKNFSKTWKKLLVLNKGYYVVSRGEEYWLSQSDSESVFYNFAAIYSEPGAKAVHRFVYTSGSSKMRKMEEIIGADIKVYINPGNTGEYYMDIRDALRKIGFSASKDA